MIIKNSQSLCNYELTCNLSWCKYFILVILVLTGGVLKSGSGLQGMLNIEVLDNV